MLENSKPSGRCTSLQLQPHKTETGILNREQWETLLAVADTFIPSIKVSSSKSTSLQLSISREQAIELDNGIRKVVPGYSGYEDNKDYLEESASSVSVDLLSRVIRDYLHQSTVKEIGVFLMLLKYDHSTLCNILETDIA